MAQVNIQYTADISQLNSKLDQIIQKQDQIIDGSKKTQKSISDASSKSADSLNKVTSSLTKVGAALGIAFSVKQIIEFTKTIFEAERSMELLQNRLNFVAGSASSGEQMFIRLEAVSRRLGLNLNDTAEGLASFGIAAKQAGFSAQKSEKIFVQVASGLRAAGASSLQTQRAFYALQQMMSKGVVAAEELRRQLGESLPGASDLMTKAYNRLHPAANLTNLEFTKLLESGKIVSKDILPVFAAVIEETFAPALAGKQNSLDASLNKVNNEILKLKLNLGNASWFKKGIDAISEGMFTLNAVMSSDKLSNLEKFNVLMFSNLASEKLQKFVGAYDDIKTAIDEFNNKVEQSITTNIVFGNALEKQSNQYTNLSAKEREETKRNTDQQIEANEEIIKSNNKNLKEYNKIVEEKKKQYLEDIKSKTIGKSIHESTYIQIELVKKYHKEIKDLQKSRSKDEQISIKQIQDAKSQNEFLKELRVSFYNLDEQLNTQDEKRREEAHEAEKQRLNEALANAKKFYLEQEKGSADQAIAAADVAKKQMELDVFMAKSKAEKDLARTEGGIKAEKEILEYQREAQKKSLVDQVEFEKERLANVEKGSRKELEIKSKLILLEAKLKGYQEGVTDQQMATLLAEADAAIVELENKFDDAANKAAEAFEKNKKKISDGIQAPFLDAIGKEEKAARDHYENLLALNKNNLDKGLITREEYNKNVIDLEEALQKELKNITEDAADDMGSEDERRLRRLLRNIQRAVNAIGGLYQDIISLDIQRNDVALQNLENRFDQGLISEKEYERQKRILLQQQFEAEKRMQIARAIMSGANSIMEIIGSPLLPLAPILIPIVVGITGTQIGIIQSQVPAFKDGVINLKGPGTGTSDSVAAMLSRGESVMTAKETEKYGDVLRSIRNGTYDSINKDKTLVVVLPFIFPTPLAASLIVGNALRPQTPEGFKDGVIGINGPGTSTSDSILARLSKGESVMTAAETNKYRDVLSAIREDSLPSLIAEKYMIPSYKNHMDESRKSKHKQTSMEMAFQAAEMVNAIKGNKVIKLHHSSIKELTANSGTRAADKILARRSFR